MKDLLTMNTSGEDKPAYVCNGVSFPFRHPSTACIWIYNSVSVLSGVWITLGCMQQKSRTQGSTILSSKSGQVECLTVKPDVSYK